ncbi:unnamed protein product [Ilex paraguariensis]|uniref:Uncharacterized protein n=1 Tax=Ilex paraguariensis TaxID=185542 RepID=A0ABC8TJZ1_9AQUA
MNEMEYDPLEEELDDHLLKDENVNDNDIIDSFEFSHGWAAWCEQLATMTGGVLRLLDVSR